MKPQWMLLPVLQLVFTYGDAGANQTVAASAAWTVSPTAPGNDLPEAGASLFDRITIDADGRQRIPYPFERLIARIEAAAGCGASRPCTRAVLIPLGRSLQRVAASPDFYAHPRVVSAVVAEGDGVLLRDRLYVGFQERAGVIEAISYNETLGRFEFQIVKNYRPGAQPEVIYARRTVCLSCHQNHGPVFSQPVWLETSANPQIAQRLQRERAAFAGVSARATTDEAQAIDDATDRSNLLALTQRLWRDGCGDAEAGNRCRAGAVTAALQRVLSGQRAYTADDEIFRRHVTQVLADNAAAQWPAGLAVPDADIPNRDPLLPPAGTRGLSLANIETRFDPLVPRPPREVIPADGEQLSRHLVTGIAALWSDSTRDALAAAMQRRAKHAAVRRIEVPCRVTGRADNEQFDCTAADFHLRGSFDATGGSLDEIGRGSDAVRYLRIASVQRQSAGRNRASFRVRDGQHTARLSDGNALEAITLTWDGSTRTPNGVAMVEVRKDFPAVGALLAGMSLDRHPLNSSLPATLIAAIDGTKPLPVSDIRPVATADRYADTAPVAYAPALPFESQCGSCHHTAETTPPNFLSGDARRVAAALQSCAPRIYVRLVMGTLPPAQRPKSPMPPESFAAISDPALMPQHPDEKSLTELRVAVAAMLTKEYGRPPLLDELLQQGYEALRPCLPPSG